MKCLLIFPFLVSFVLAQPSADEILADYYKEVGLKIAKNPGELGSMDGILKKYEELGKKHLFKNKETLHKKAVKDYLALPELTFTELKNEEKIAWIENSKFVKGDVIDHSLVKTGLENLTLMFDKSGYGNIPFDRHVLSTQWWSPKKVVKTVRELAYNEHLKPNDIERRKFVEQYNSPLFYRVGNDGEAPCIVMFDGLELFAVNLKYVEQGIYCVTALKWVKLKDKKEVK